jgi:hypothetical protein
MAMVDMNFDVIEYRVGKKRYFASTKLGLIMPKPKDGIDNPNGSFSWTPPKDAQVFNWSRDKDLITLTASDALKAGICDSIAKSKYELIEKLDLANTKIVTDNGPLRARRAVETAQKTVNATIVRIEKRFQTFSKTSISRQERYSQLTKMAKEVRSALILADKYPEIALEREALRCLESKLNSALK